MNKRKLIGSMVIGLAALMLTSQSHAEGRVFGNVGIEDAPWSILIGYNDYGRHYYEPRRVEHHHYYHKPRRHHGHERHHYKRRHGHHRRHHYRHDNYCHYGRRH